MAGAAGHACGLAAGNAAAQARIGAAGSHFWFLGIAGMIRARPLHSHKDGLAALATPLGRTVSSSVTRR